MKKQDYWSYGEEIGEALVLAVGRVEEGTFERIIDKLDDGYQAFKEWFDHYFIQGAKEAYFRTKEVGSEIKEDITHKAQELYS